MDLHIRQPLFLGLRGLASMHPSRLQEGSDIGDAWVSLSKPFCKSCHCWSRGQNSSHKATLCTDFLTLAHSGEGGRRVGKDPTVARLFYMRFLVSPLAQALEPESRILMFLWSLGLLVLRLIGTCWIHHRKPDPSARFGSLRESKALRKDAE